MSKLTSIAIMAIAASFQQELDCPPPIRQARKETAEHKALRQGRAERRKRERKSRRRNRV